MGRSIVAIIAVALSIMPTPAWAALGDRLVDVKDDAGHVIASEVKINQAVKVVLRGPGCHVLDKKEVRRNVERVDQGDIGNYFPCTNRNVVDNDGL